MESKIFPTQGSDENVLLVIREHPYVLAGKLMPAVGFLIIGVIGLGIVPLFVSNIWNWPLYVPILSILVLIGWGLLFYGWLLYYLTVVVITNLHLVDIDQNSLFNKKISELNHENIEDVTASQSGILATSLGFGSVIVQTAGEIPEFQIHNIANPYDIARQILDLCSASRTGGNIPPNVPVVQTPGVSQPVQPPQPPAPPLQPPATPPPAAPPTVPPMVPPAVPPAGSNPPPDDTSVFPL